MRRLYKWQQILAITRTEAVTLATLSGLFILGSAVKHFQSVHVPYNAGTYATDDSLLQAGLESIQREHSPQIDTIRVRPDSLAATAALADPGNAPSAAVRSRKPANRASAGVPLNINTASARLLQRLPGIGPALADRIIRYRETRGPFKEPAGILGVSGIGPKTFEKLKPFLFVPVEADSIQQPQAGSDSGS